MKTIKKSVSILLAVIMVFSLFTIVPFTASAATTYTINWSWRDINSHSEQTQVEEGEMPTHADPVLESDVKVNYVFDGWTPKIVPATSNAYYNARVVEYPIFYSVGDSINFKSSEYVRGTKWSDPTYEVSGSATVVSAVYNSEKSCYDLVLQSGDDTIELTASGSVQYDNFAVQISGSGASNYPYSFRVVRLGTVIWKDEDGNILETDENVPHGSRPTFNGTYSKESESPEDYYYVTKWFTENSDGSISTTPYSHNRLSYVSYYSNSSQKIYHGKIIKVKYLKPGVVYFHQDGIDFNNSYAKVSSASGVYRRSEMNIISELRLNNASNNEYKVALASDSGSSVSYYYAKYDESLGEKVAWKCVSGDGTQDNPYTFEFVPYGDVTWKLDEDTVIDTTKVVYGDAPTHDDPTKADDEQNSYTFAGWSDGTNFYRPNALPRVTGDITFTAIFDASPFVASVTSNGTTTKYTDFAQAVNAWAPASVADGSTLTLLADVSYNPGISVQGTKTLDLNGHGITGTGTIAFGGNGTLTDSDPTAVHYFDVQNGLAVNVNNSSGSNSFNGGYLTGGTGDWGSAIQISGTLTMDGGTILGNTSNYSGAVRVHSNATFIMTGGQIIYNRCAAQRGGNDASLNAESQATILLSGNPVIKNNVNPSGNPANVMVRQTLTKKLNVIGTLTDGAEIGITMQDNIGRDYTGAFTASSDISFNDQTKFFSDKSDYIVGKNADGQLILGVPRTITWKDDQGNTIDTTTVADGGVPTHDDPTKPDDENNTYTFAGWKNGDTTYAPGAALPEVTGDTTYTAQFTAVPNVISIRMENGKLMLGDSVWTTTYDGGFNRYILPSGKYRLDSNITTNYRIRVNSGNTAVLDIGDYNIERLRSEGDAIEVAGDLTINGNNGKIINNNFGSSVLIVPGGKLTLNGGTITNNGGTNPSRREGVNVGGEFVMNGGSLANNTKAVRLDDAAGIFKLNGGSITDNTYGVMLENSNATFTISGDPVITGNTTDVYLANGKKINIGGELTNTTPIKVTMQTPGVFTSGLSGNGTKDNFVSSNSNQEVYLADNGEAAIRTLYTITWKMDDGSIIDTTRVGKDEKPTHDAPAKNDANGNPYTFGGWKNGTTTYAPNAALPAVTGDTTYTATYKKLIKGHSLTLDGDIGINFYIDPSVAGMNPGDSGTLTVDFKWANDDPLVDVVSQSTTVAVNSSNYSRVGDLVKVTCNVCAAEMTCDVKATASLNGKTEAEYYSVRKYCDTILDRTSEDSKRIIARDGEEKYLQLVDLVNKMLDYGAKAQTTFGINIGYFANKDLDYTMQTVTDDMFAAAVQTANGRDADDIAAKAPAGSSFKAPSLVFLTKNTLRLYFEKTGNSFNTSGLTKWNNYYYAQVTNIAAAELDTLQSFSVSGTTLKYSALDYARALAKTANSEIAMAIYWYNKAANVFFNDPGHIHTPGEPVQENVSNATCTAEGSYEEVVYCTECGSEVSRETKTIEKAAHTLTEVAEVPATYLETGVQAHYECSVCGKLFTDAQGNNETTIEALTIPKSNVVPLNELTGNYEAQDGQILTGTLSGNKKITIAPGATVTLKDANITSLVDGSGYAGITPLGDATIILEGTNTVKGGVSGAGWGYYPGIYAPQGYTLTIDGTGSLDASSELGSGIGGGFSYAYETLNAGNIIISGGTITATGGMDAAGIGAGYRSSCGNILIKNTVTKVTATKGSGAPNSIGAGSNGTCGTVTIEPGANVIQN